MMKTPYPAFLLSFLIPYTQKKRLLLAGDLPEAVRERKLRAPVSYGFRT